MQVFVIKLCTVGQEQNAEVKMLRTWGKNDNKLSSSGRQARHMYVRE